MEFSTNKKMFSKKFTKKMRNGIHPGNPRKTHTVRLRYFGGSPYRKKGHPDVKRGFSRYIDKFKPLTL